MIYSLLYSIMGIIVVLRTLLLFSITQTITIGRFGYYYHETYYTVLQDYSSEWIVYDRMFSYCDQNVYNTKDITSTFYEIVLTSLLFPVQTVSSQLFVEILVLQDS